MSFGKSPNYVQMLCFHPVAEGYKKIRDQEVEIILKKVVRQNAYAYQTILTSLTLIQQRTLRLAAKEEKQVFAKELLEKYEIPGPAAPSSVLNALKNKGILDEEGMTRGKVIFDGPLFAVWLKIAFA